MIRLAAAAFAVLLPASALATPLELEVARSPECGCCHAWAETLEAAGHRTRLVDMAPDALARHKTALGIAPHHASCHTARVDGYVVEGHVPAADIERLLRERPAGALGLAAPGMPLGSPGMEADGTVEAHDVLLVMGDGTARVWTHYPARP